MNKQSMSGNMPFSDISEGNPVGPTKYLNRETLTFISCSSSVPENLNLNMALTDVFLGSFETYESEERTLSRMKPTEHDGISNLEIHENTDFEEFLTVPGQGGVVARSSIKIKRDGRDCTFHCCECKETFSDRGSVITHLFNHVDCKPFSCVCCNLLLSTENEARAHFKNHFTTESIPTEHSALNSETSIELTQWGHLDCSPCGKAFDSIETALDHKRSLCRSDEETSEHTCPHCNKKFSSAAYLESHIRSLHSSSNKIENSGSYSCNDLNNRKRERKWICPTCGKTFRSSTSLHEHTVVHTGARNFPCKICGKAFGTAANMRIHLLTHSDQRPFSCQTCGATFRQKDSLKVHIRKHTGERPFVCTICKTAFDRNFTLKNHMLTHTEKSFVCCVCGKAFATRGGLNNHERLHFKDPSQSKKERRPRAKAGTGGWVCEECGKMYSSRSNLKMHKKSHELTKVCHICPVCSQSYKSRDSMEVHMRRHNEDRPFKCPMCSRSFYRSYTLKIHFLIHSGEKPHHCPINGCNKSFAQTSSLSYHVRNHQKKEERSRNESNTKRPYRKHKAAENNFSSKSDAQCTANIIDCSPMNDCRLASEDSGTEDLKLGISSVVPPSTIENTIGNVGCISNSVAHLMDHSLPTAWGEPGVVHNLQHAEPSPTSMAEHSMLIAAQQQQSQHVPFMHYVSPEAMRLLVNVPEGDLYQQGTVHKVLDNPPLVVPHLP